MAQITCSQVASQGPPGLTAGGRDDERFRFVELPLAAPGPRPGLDQAGWSPRPVIGRTGPGWARAARGA